MRKTFFLIFLFFIVGFAAFAQQEDSLVSVPDTGLNKIQIEPAEHVATINSLVKKNAWINSTAKPQALYMQPHQAENISILFYALAGLVLFLGILKTVFSKYFVTLFQVFFNSSLRQSQLTDQLMQSRLPSLFLNLLFVVSAAFYLGFLYRYFIIPGTAFSWKIFSFALIIIAGMYLVKFIVLKFIGWLTGYSNEADTYAFILFLINKMIGIILLPVIIVLAFVQGEYRYYLIVLSFIIIGLLVVMRFLRAYGLLEHKLMISRFHFMLYIFSMEILPLLLLYKAGMLFVGKNL
ncbi:MAG: DUF4271 domain-containing protein [Ferruginibacter sp.]